MKNFEQNKTIADQYARLYRIHNDLLDAQSVAGFLQCPDVEMLHCLDFAREAIAKHLENFKLQSNTTANLPA